MREMHLPGPANHDRPKFSEIGATASALLRYAVLVALAIFLILVMFPVALAAAGQSTGAHI